MVEGWLECNLAIEGPKPLIDISLLGTGELNGPVLLHRTCHTGKLLDYLVLELCIVHLNVL